MASGAIDVNHKDEIYDGKVTYFVEIKNKWQDMLYTINYQRVSKVLQSFKYLKHKQSLLL